MKIRKYESKLFSNGNILLALALAVRGMPRTWQPEEQPVTRQSGWAIYEDEIALLDPIIPQLRIFQSGVLGAALITVAIEPKAVEFWRLLNDESWTRYSDGRIDPAGWLLQQILRHSGNCEIALRPDYQQYLFQASLAAAMAWCESRKIGKTVWLSSEPHRVEVGQVLESVRSKKGLRRTSDGFRPAKALVGRIPTLAPTVIEHSIDLDLAVLMAEQVADIKEYSFDVDQLSAARAALTRFDIPAELAAPGALAACLVSLVRNPSCVAIWENVLAGRWSHGANKGSNAAGLITRSIQVDNRRWNGVSSQALLFARILMALKNHARRSTGQEEPRTASIPRAFQIFVEQIVVAWINLPVLAGPRIHSGQVQPLLKGTGADQARPVCQKRRGRGRALTGRRAEMIFERFHKQCRLPRAGRLIDRTRDQCGYDYELDSDPEPLWVFEVKMVGDKGFILTEMQWQVAQELGDCYWLVLVREHPDVDDEVMFIRDPFAVLQPEKDTRLVVQTTHRVKSRAWKKEAKTLSLLRPLTEK